MSDFVVGTPVRGDDFFFRRSFVDDLWDALMKNNALLLAPRRMGKTSVMDNLVDNPRHDFRVISINVESFETPTEFFLELLDALKEDQPDYVRDHLAKGLGYLKKALGRIEGVSVSEFKLSLRKLDNWEREWRERGQNLFNRIEHGDMRILFIIDEFPDMLINMRKKDAGAMEAFLQFFRTVRQQRESKMRWLIAGSVNVRGTLAQYGLLPTINDLQAVPLPPFTADETAEFVVTMLGDRQVNYDPMIIPHIQLLLGEPVPFFLQMLTQQMHRHWKQHKRALTTADVDVVFERDLLGELARDRLQHFRERIFVYYPDEERDAACEVLDMLSLSTHGISRDALFQYYRVVEAQKTVPRAGNVLEKGYDNLLYLLQSDFYVDEASKGLWNFKSTLLKRWWAKYYGYKRTA